MAFSINGVGTTFYGRANPGKDGSYVVTKWVVIAFVPMVPLGSLRVLPVSQSDRPWWKRSLGQQFRAAKVPLHIPQVLKGYAVTIGLFILLKFF
jgi:hypothetical protein